MSAAPSAAAAAPVDPQVIAAAEARLVLLQNDLRADEARLEQAKNDLHDEEARLAKEEARVEEAKTCLDHAIAIRAELIQAAERRPSMNNLKGKRQATQRFREALRQAQCIVVPPLHTTSSLERTMRKLNERIEQLNQDFEYEKNKLNQERPRLEQAIRDANASVKAQERTVQDEKEYLERLRGIPATDYLARALAYYALPREPVTYRMSIENMTDWAVPRFAAWEDFTPNVLFQQLAGRMVRGCAGNEVATSVGMFAIDSQFNAVWSMPCDHMFTFASEMFTHLDWEGVSTSGSTGRGGILEELVGRFKAQDLVETFFFMAQKCPSNTFPARVAGVHPSDYLTRLREYVRPDDGDVETYMNLFSAVLEVFGYQLGKENAKYGMLSNWNSWYFFKRTRNQNNEEVLLVSDMYDLSTARCAYIYFLKTVMEDSNRTLACGKFNVMNTLNLWKRIGLKQTEQSERGSAPAISSMERFGQILTLRADVHVLYTSDRSAAYRGIVDNGLDAVWKLYDFRGLRNLGIHWEDMKAMMENEVQIYYHLGQLGMQGVLVPRFIHLGPDFMYLWILMTSYEGVSLKKLVDKYHGLTADTKTRAVEALEALHRLGVSHNDVELNNFVWRGRDGAVLCIDFHVSVLQEDVTEKGFAGFVEEDSSRLERALEETPTIDAYVVAVEAGAPSSTSTLSPCDLDAKESDGCELRKRCKV